MPNVRDNLSLYLVTALTAIVCLASVGQAVISDPIPSASIQPANVLLDRAAVERAANFARLHDAQVRDAS